LRILIISVLLIIQTFIFAQNELRIGIKLNQPVIYLSSNYQIVIPNTDEKKSIFIDIDKTLTCAYLKEGIAVSEKEGKLLFITKSPVSFIPKPTVNATDIPYMMIFFDEIKNSRQYRGFMEVDFTPNGLNIVNVVSIEDYLRGVVSAEMNGSYPLEALKAQAVAARTYAERSRGKMKSLGFDMDDTTRFQVYGGMKIEDNNVNKAIESTSGMTLMYKNQLAETVFSSNCGGWTESSASAWGNDIPYLQSISDLVFERNGDKESTAYWLDFCTNFKLSFCLQPKYERAENYRWLKVITRDDLEKKIPIEYQVGKILEISILERGNSGRITKMSIKGVDKIATIEKEYNIRRVFGGLKSSCFVIDCYKDEIGSPIVFILRGAGYGHGVGMCQTGAAGRADAGWGFEKILKFYYPGTTLQKKEK
jgi:stage II sporulation protein D